VTRSRSKTTLSPGTTNLKVEAAIGEDENGNRLVTDGLEQKCLGELATRIGSDGDPYDTTDNVDRKAVTIWTCFRLPADVGNVVQGDSLSWDLRFLAEQVRNNVSPSEGDLTFDTQISH